MTEPKKESPEERANRLAREALAKQVQSVEAALADERRNPNVRVGVGLDPAGAVRVTLFTRSPFHMSEFSLTPLELRNPEQRYLVELGKHERALANLTGRGAK